MNGPTPTYHSNRLVGIELEIDIGHNPRAPRQASDVIPSVRGWKKQYDGSLGNGQELVLDPPKTLDTAMELVDNLCSQLLELNVRKSGGLHVHVAVPDYTHEDATNLVKLYTHFQPVINKLVGQSRVHNTYCPAYTQAQLNTAFLVQHFSLNRPAQNRGEAKGSRRYSVVNLAMMRCTNPNHRTVEFRQGSVSKRAVCVGGWATLMTALVDMARRDWATSDLNGTGTLEKLLEMLKIQELATGSTKVAEWVQWRYDYLNADPTNDLIDKLMDFVKGGRTVGIYGTSRALDINLAMALKVLQLATNRGLIRQDQGVQRWRASYEGVAAADLEMLKTVARRPQPAAPATVTTADAMLPVAHPPLVS
jgi:hypothetical protein